MARITVDDCLKSIPNRFELTLAATYRARQIAHGAHAAGRGEQRQAHRHRAARDRRRQGRHGDAEHARCRPPPVLTAQARGAPGVRRATLQRRRASADPATVGVHEPLRLKADRRGRCLGPWPLEELPRPRLPQAGRRRAASSEAYHFSEAAHAGQFRKSRRAVHLAPARGRRHPRASGTSTPQALIAALLHDVIEDTAVTKDEISEQLRQAGRRAGRRRLQARPDRVRDARGRAGRELPQDAARDGARRARHPDQARRPPAQHAHARGGARRRSGAASRARRSRSTRRSRTAWA